MKNSSPTTHQVDHHYRGPFLSNDSVFDGDLFLCVTRQCICLLHHLQEADCLGVSRGRLGHRHCVVASLVVSSSITRVASFGVLLT